MILLKNNKQNKGCRFFTLVELMVSMFLFLVIMAIVARYFAAANRAWRITARKNEVYANARVALDLMVRDLQGAMYNNDWTVPGRGIYPFFHYNPGTSAATGEQLCMITQTPLTPLGATSNVCEVRYSYYRDNNDYATGTEDTRRENEFWLVRSCTPNKNSTGADNGAYDFAANPIDKISSGTLTWRGAAVVGNIFNSSNAWQKVIPHVMNLEFKCYKSDLTIQNALTASTITGSDFPVRVKVVLTVLDDASFIKYRTLRDAGASSAAQFLSDNQLTFSRTVYMRTKESF